MNFKRNINKLNKFKKNLKENEKKEIKEIQSLIQWRTTLQNKIKTKSRIINVRQIKDWFFDNNKNLYHKSKQFFKVRGVVTKGANGREVNSWTQPILTQKHGGVLAFIARETKDLGIQFLVEAKVEPGDNSKIKISPSFQATQSNMNRAHGGKRPNFYDIIGNVNLEFSSGSKLSLVSDLSYSKKHTVQINTKTNIIDIDELSGKVMYNKNYKFTDKILLQSLMSTELVKDIINYGKCNLTLLSEHLVSHNIFIDFLIDKYNKDHNTKNIFIPIT